MAHWSENPQQLSDFGEVLEEAVEDFDLHDLVRQPYKYDDIYDNWKDAGFPLPNSGEDWDTFLETITSEEEEEETE